MAKVMEVTRLSDEGQIVIPPALRAAHQWEVRQELVVIDMGDGILLKPKKPFAETNHDQVAGCLSYKDASKRLADMDNAIRQGGMEQWHDRS